MPKKPRQIIQKDFYSLFSTSTISFNDAIQICIGSDYFRLLSKDGIGIEMKAFDFQTAGHVHKRIFIPNNPEMFNW